MWLKHRWQIEGIIKDIIEHLCRKVDESFNLAFQTSIVQVNVTKFLGVLIDNNLSWKSHTSHIAKIVSRYNILYFILTYCIPLLVMLLCYVQMGKVYLLLFRKTKEGESAVQIALCINPEIYLCLWCLYYLLIWQYFTRCCGETSHLAKKMSPRGKARKQNKRQLQDYVS